MKITKEKKGMQIQILFLLFVVGGIFGFVYEELFYRIDLGYFVKRGMTFGPWIPLYAFGAVVITYFTEKIRKHPLAVFLSTAVAAGVIEYVTGYFLDRFLHLRLWDYRTEIWNWLQVEGFICLRSVLFFAFAGLLFQYVFYPLLLKLADRLEPKKLNLLSGGLMALFVLDIVVSLVYHAFVK